MKQLVLVLIVVGFSLMTARGVVATELFDQAHRDYVFQLEKYRDEYRVFDLKRTQYRNLQTFASQNEMVLTAKTMLSRRADVWHAYLQALRTQLVEANGMMAAGRDIFVQKIVDWEIFVANEKQQVAEADTKDSLLAAAQVLDIQHEKLQSFSYEVVGNLAWAHLEEAVITARDLRTQLQQAVEVQIREVDTRSVRLHGFDEVDKSLTLAQQILDTVKAERLHFGDSYDVSNQYKKAMDELTPAHVQVRRAYQLLSELSTGVEL